MSPPWKFVFLDLPLLAREEVYDNLLVRHSNWSANIVDPGYPDVYDLDCAIMATNRRVHDEAAKILYGRNVFGWHARGVKRQGLFKVDYNSLPAISSHYMRLIRKVQLEVSVAGDDNDPSIAAMHAGFATSLANVKDIVEALDQTNLTKLSISLWNGYTGGPFLFRKNDRRFGGDMWYGEWVLEPLAELRGVKKVELGAHISPGLKARLTRLMRSPCEDLGGTTGADAGVEENPERRKSIATKVIEEGLCLLKPRRYDSDEVDKDDNDGNEEDENADNEDEDEVDDDEDADDEDEMARSDDEGH